MQTQAARDKNRPNAVCAAQAACEEEGAPGKAACSLLAAHHEEVIRIGRGAADAENFHEIMELRMNVTANNNRGLH